MCREQDACGFRRHQQLHDDGHADTVGLDVVLRAVADGPRRPQRSPAALHGVEHRRAALHVEKGLLLPGEREVWQVLRCRRRAHRDGGCVTREPRVRRQDGLLDLGGHVRPTERRANRLRRRVQPFGLGGRDLRGSGRDEGVKLVGAHVLSVRGGADDETIGHRQTGRDESHE